MIKVLAAVPAETVLNLAKEKFSCWDGTDFSIQSRFRYKRIGSCGSTIPVLVPQFLFLFLDTRVSVQRSQGVVCSFLISVLVRFHFGSISAPNLKLLY